MQEWGRRAFIGLAIAAGIALGCAPKQPTMQSGPAAEITHDGLHRVDNAGFAAVWVKPGANLGRYSKILPMEPTFHYRTVQGSGRSSGDYEVPERRREDFERIVKESFRKSFEKSKYYTMATEPGPDTLVLLGAIHDIVSHVPQERGERSDTFVSEIGEATIVLELRDSESHEVLARAAERRSVTPTRELTWSSSVSSASEIRKVAALWGGKLRDQLDALHERQGN
jgi:hypothetical protein